MQQRRVMLIPCQFPPHGGVGVLRTLKFCKYLPLYGWSSVVLSHRIRRDFDPIDQSLLSDVPAGTMILRPPLLDLAYVRFRIQRLAVALGRIGNTQRAPTAQAPGASRERPRDSTLMLLWNLLTNVPDNRAGWFLPAVATGLKFARQCDCIVATGPPFTPYLVGWTLHQLTGTPLVLDLRDPWSFNPWLSRTPSWGPAMHRRFEALCMSSASAAISSTEEIHDKLRETYPFVPAHRFAIIPNGYDPGDMPEETELSAVPRPMEPMTIAYFGSLYSNRNPAPLFEAIRLLKSDGLGAADIRVQHIGPVSTAAESAARAAGVSEIFESVGRLEYRAALRRMRESSILLIVGADDTDRYCVATKTYEYLWSRRPVLALVPPGPIERLVKRERVGRVVNPNDANAIAIAIRGMLAAHQAGELSVGASQRIEAFNRESLTREFAALLTHVSRNRIREGRRPIAHRKSVPRASTRVGGHSARRRRTDSFASVSQ